MIRDGTGKTFFSGACSPQGGSVQSVVERRVSREKKSMKLHLNPLELLIYLMHVYMYFTHAQ